MIFLRLHNLDFLSLLGLICQKVAVISIYYMHLKTWFKDIDLHAKMQNIHFNVCTALDTFSNKNHAIIVLP